MRHQKVILLHFSVQQIWKIRPVLHAQQTGERVLSHGRKWDFRAIRLTHSDSLTTGYLLTYGYRHEPYGIRARILNPECTDYQTSKEIILRDDGGNSDIGYTWPVMLDKKRVLVVYYFNINRRAQAYCRNNTGNSIKKSEMIYQIFRVGKIYPTLIFLSVCILLNRCKSVSDDPVTIGNTYFEYAVSADGKNIHFIDKTTGIDYLDKKSNEASSFIRMGGKQFNASSVSVSGRKMRIEFGGTDVTATIRIKKGRDRITFTVTGISGNPESFTFLNVPLTLEGMPDEPFAACVLSMNLFTHVRQLPALQTHLWATCYSRFGFVGAEITLLGVPQENILPVIRDVMSKAKDVPFSDKGGAWALYAERGIWLIPDEFRNSYGRER